MYIYITVQKSNYICTFVHIQVRIHKYTFTPIKRKKLTVTIYIYIAKKPLCDLLDVLQTFTYRTYIDIYIYVPFPSVSGIYDLPECVPSSRRQYLGESFQLKQCSRRPETTARCDWQCHSSKWVRHERVSTCALILMPKQLYAHVRPAINSTVCLGRPPGIVEGR